MIIFIKFAKILFVNMVTQPNIISILSYVLNLKKEQKGTVDPDLSLKIENLVGIIKTTIKTNLSIEQAFQKSSNILQEIYLDILSFLIIGQKYEYVFKTINQTVRQNLNIDFFKKNNVFLDKILISNLGFALRVLNKIAINISSSTRITDNIDLANQLAIYDAKMTFCILSAIIIELEGIKVPSEKMNELARFMAESAQKYGALAMQLGIIEQKFPKRRFLFNNINTDEIQNEQYLAEQGIIEYSQILKDYEI